MPVCEPEGGVLRSRKDRKQGLNSPEEREKRPLPQAPLNPVKKLPKRVCEIRQHPQPRNKGEIRAVVTPAKKTARGW